MKSFNSTRRRIMFRRKFKVDYIEEFVDQLGYDWPDRKVYLRDEEKYRKGTRKRFNGEPIFIYIQDKQAKHYILTLARIDNEEFILFQGQNITDASSEWRQFIADKKAVEKAAKEEMSI